MHTVFAKEHEGIPQNPIRSVPWWSGLGSQTAYGESLGLLKSSSTTHPATGDQFATAKQAEPHREPGLEKGNATQFTIFPGDGKSSTNGPKPSPLLQAGISMQSAPPEYRGGFELGFGQPVICAKYPYGNQCYGMFSTYGQMTGRIMLPLNLSIDNEPIFVNAKQYHGIIRRRQSRAKAEVENKEIKRRKPYLHLSRHLHAMRRPRGCGGRFLNTKNLNGSTGGPEMKKTDGQLSQPTGSQNSEIVQSDGGNSSSSKETNGHGSNISGLEVTSMYSRGDLNCFPINHFRSSVYPFSNTMTTRHGIIRPSHWVAAADSCSNLKV